MAFNDLIEKALTASARSELNARYDGTNQLPAVGISVPPNVRALEMNVNWCRLAVDSMAEVLTVEGFECVALPDEVISQIWAVWQSSNMRTLSHLAHTEALTQGTAYAVVGRGVDGVKLNTRVLSVDNVAVTEDDEGTREAVVVRTVRRDNRDVTEAAYYTPERLEVFERSNVGWHVKHSEPGCGLVPVIPLRNKTRVGDARGRSDMDLVKDYADAASRSFTLLQLATELLSMPQRYILGGKREDFVNKNGELKTGSELYLGAFLMGSDPNAKAGQFEGANLEQIISVLKYCAECVSAVTGIPASMLGIGTGHPSSAEAMRAAKERMISRGELKQALFGDSWEQWARVVMAFLNYPLEQAASLATVWRDIAVPSNSAKSAYLLQAHAQGVISARTAREGLPLTPEQRAREDKNSIEAEEYGLPSPVRTVI